MQRLAHGVELPDVIWRQIEECAERFDVALDEDAVAAADVERYADGVGADHAAARHRLGAWQPVVELGVAPGAARRPGWQGATNEHVRACVSEEQRSQPGMDRRSSAADVSPRAASPGPGRGASA